MQMAQGILLRVDHPLPATELPAGASLILRLGGRTKQPVEEQVLVVGTRVHTLPGVGSS